MPKLLSSVKKALDLPQAFSGDRPELSLAEISTRLRSHKSSISRILSTLASKGFVELLVELERVREKGYAVA